MLCNFKLPMPNDIGHVLQTITEDGEMHLAICHADGTAWNPMPRQRFPTHVLQWLQSHRYAARLFEGKPVVWIDYVAPDWMTQSNTSNAFTTNANHHSLTTGTMVYPPPKSAMLHAGS